MIEINFKVDTEENILLRSGECSLYAWRSQKTRLQLRLCVDGGFWKWCDPFNIMEGIRSIRFVIHKCFKQSTDCTGNCCYFFVRSECYMK